MGLGVCVMVLLLGLREKKKEKLGSVWEVFKMKDMMQCPTRFLQRCQCVHCHAVAEASDVPRTIHDTRLLHCF